MVTSIVCLIKLAGSMLIKVHLQTSLKIQDFTNHSPLASYSESINDETMEIDDEPTKNKQPTGFLDLPRELRQTILDYSYEAKEVEFAKWYEAYMYVDWANVLREVHEVVAEDVEYMEKRWNRRVVIKGWKEKPVAEAANGGMSEAARLISVRQNIHPGFDISETEGRRWLPSFPRS